MYNYVMSLLKIDLFNKGKSKVINNFDSILESATEEDIIKLFQVKKFISIIVDKDFFFTNLEKFSSKLSSSNIVSCIMLLYKENNKYVLENKEKLFTYYNDSEFLTSYLSFLSSININASDLMNYFDTNKVVLDYNALVCGIIKFNGGKQILSRHMSYILDNNYKLLQLRGIVRGTDLEYSVKDKIDLNPDKIVYEIINRRSSIKKEELEKSNGISFLRNLIDELLKNEGKKYSDINLISQSDISDVYEIGNKILKISNEKKNFSLLNNKRFLKPLYRQNIMSNTDFLYCVEVTEKVDMNSVTPENLYQVYKELRDQGLVWVACQMDNLGRLIRDNKVYFNGNSMFNQQLNQDDDVLKRGDIVILTSNYIYPYEEFKKLDIKQDKLLSNIYRYNALRSLEERYLQEQNQMVNKK